MMAVGLRTVLVCWLLAASTASAAGPGWGESSVNPAGTHSPWPGRGGLSLQCPAVYTGIKSGLLPTGWVASDSGVPAEFVRSQVQGNDLFCVYRVPGVGRVGHASVSQRVPAGFRCETAGAGTFACRQGRQPFQGEER